MSAGKAHIVTSRFKLDESKLIEVGFGGQDKPDNVIRLNERVTEQELLVVDMHVMINELRSELKESKQVNKSLKKKSELAIEILNNIWTDLNTGTESITLKSYRQLEELCS